MNRYAKFLVIPILTIVLLSGICNVAVFADEVVNTRIEISKFIPVKDAIVWKYKTVKGKLYMRQYNSTTKKWICEWRLVPGQ